MSSIIYANVVGGLGNQLFIIATALAYSKKHNKTLHCFFNHTEKRQNHFNLPIGLPNDTQIGLTYHEPRFSYTEIPFVDGNILITGYFQCAKYFDAEIISSITIPKSLNYTFPVIPETKTPVCIHIRRTDYIMFQDFHCLPPDDYYTKAINIMREKLPNPYFLIFSDDIEYVNNTVIGDITNDEKVVVDQCNVDCINIMRECNHFIIANSSFSWWGAMLGGYTTVIAPKTWFGEKGPQDWQDIYQPDWIII